MDYNKIGEFIANERKAKKTGMVFPAMLDNGLF